jgi:hypothetical protein
MTPSAMTRRTRGMTSSSIADSEVEERGTSVAAGQVGVDGGLSVEIC